MFSFCVLSLNFLCFYVCSFFRLKIQSKYAFGKDGNKEYNIPPNAAVEYTVKLIDCEKGTEEWKLSNEERLEHAKLFKEKGTKYFKKENFTLAKKMYQKCVDIIREESKCCNSLDGRVLGKIRNNAG